MFLCCKDFFRTKYVKLLYELSNCITEKNNCLCIAYTMLYETCMNTILLYRYSLKNPFHGLRIFSSSNYILYQVNIILNFIIPPAGKTNECRIFQLHEIYVKIGEVSI